MKPAKDILQLALLVWSFFFNAATQDSLSGHARDVGFFWQLTDIDFDPEYNSGGEPNNQCHRKEDGGVSVNESSSIYGEYVCDTPIALLHSATRTLLEKTGYVPDFVLFTGNAPHRNEASSTDLVLKGIMRVYNEIRSSINEIRVLPCLGQNDFFPRGKHTVEKNISGLLLYKDYAHLYRLWINDQEALDKFSNTGYYAVSLGRNNQLRIIVLNTNLFVETHIASLFPDPGNHWAWLEDELIKAKSRKHSVYLVMSVPPGVYEKVHEAPGHHWYHPQHNRRFIQMVRRFSDVIKGQFAGHNHEDSFRVFHNRRERPISWMLLAPSLSPRYTGLGPSLITHSNPALRMYMYNTRSFEVVDYTQYYLNLTLAGMKKKARWEIEYTFSTYYSVPNVSVYGLQLLIQRLKDDNRFFQRYYEATTVQAEPASLCDYVCKRFHMCAFSNVDYSAFFECISALDASYLKRSWGRQTSGVSTHRPPTTLAVYLLLLPTVLATTYHTSP